MSVRNVRRGCHTRGRLPTFFWLKKRNGLQTHQALQVLQMEALRSRGRQG